MAYKNNQDSINYQKQYYQKNKERIIVRSAKHYKKNKLVILARNKKLRQSEHGKAMNAKRNFNISYEEALNILSIKKCQICGRTEFLAIDHDHKTGKVRGRLCYRCNRAIGALGDTVELLEKAVEYLKNVNNVGGYLHELLKEKYERDILQRADGGAQNPLQGKKVHRAKI